MHYSVIVMIEKERTDIEKAVAEKLERYEGPFWDWYQIGGRWTGRLDNYDPEKDPKNIETCDLCKGTGKREDMKVENGCNGCLGKGTRVKWPTEWEPREGDCQSLEKIPEDFKPHSFVDFYGRWLYEIPEEEWKKEIADNYHRDNYKAVIVDCHN